jgi:protein Mpv17
MSTTNRTIAARVACDQFVFAPVNMGLFLSSMAYFEGASPKERLQKAYLPGMVNNFLLWPWVQAVNFRFVPPEFRVLIVNFVALGESNLIRATCTVAFSDDVAFDGHRADGPQAGIATSAI